MCECACPCSILLKPLKTHDLGSSFFRVRLSSRNYKPHVKKINKHFIFSSCGSENVVQVNGVYLDVPWDEEFANTSSKVFKQMAAQRAYQLFSLVQIQDNTGSILGEYISFFMYLLLPLIFGPL